MPAAEQTDADLLSLTSAGDRHALGKLVVRYVDLVHSAAVRQTTDVATAADVTQAVFLVLAEKARAVRGPALPTWLVQTTRYTVANVHRAERRRRRRDRLAAKPERVMQPDVAERDPLLALLDDAIASLGATDRVAVVARYLLGQDLPAVAAALGTSPEAARKRTERAVAKRRGYFARHGTGTVTTAAVATALSAAAPSSTPAGVVATVVATSASPHLVPASSAFTVKGVVTMLMWNQAKVAAAALVVAVVGTGIGLETVRRASGAGPSTAPAPSVAGPAPATTPSPKAADTSTPAGTAAAFVEAVCRGDVQAAERLCECDRDDEPALTVSLKQEYADIRMHTAAIKAFGRDGDVGWFAQGCTDEEARRSAANATFVIDGDTATSDGFRLKRSDGIWRIVPAESQLRPDLTALKFVAAKQLTAREIEAGHCRTPADAEKAFQARFAEMDEALGDLSGSPAAASISPK